MSVSNLFSYKFSVTFIFTTILINTKLTSQNDKFVEYNSMLNQLRIISLGLMRNLLVLDYTHTQFEDDPQNPNVLFSPISIYQTIGILMLATEENTRREIECLLNLTTKYFIKNGVEVKHQAIGKFVITLLSNVLTVRIANGIFVQNGYPILSNFINSADDIYNAEIHTVDFLKDLRGTHELMNRWASKHTGGKMRKLLKEFKSDATLIFTGATIYKADWEYPFLTENTKWELFYLGRGNSSKKSILVQMMSNEAKIPFYEDVLLGYKTIGIPCKCKNSYMYVVLPNSSSQLKLLAATFDNTDIDNILQNSKISNVLYFMPKMKLETTFNLKDTLQKLNVHKAFDPVQANFSSLADVPNGTYTSDILEKIKVDIRESKTITPNSMNRSSTDKSNYIYFRADRPFLFFIYNIKVSLITLWGTMHKPEPCRYFSKVFKSIIRNKS